MAQENNFIFLETVEDEQKNIFEYFAGVTNQKSFSETTSNVIKLTDGNLIAFLKQRFKNRREVDGAGNRKVVRYEG